MGAAAELLEDTLDALAEHIAILGEKGEILAVNAAWRKVRDEEGLCWAKPGVGDNCLEMCARVNCADTPKVRALAAGMREVLEGRAGRFEIEYPCTAEGRNRWFHLRVTRFEEGGRPRLVLAQQETTAQRLAEQALRENEAELRQAQKMEAVGRLAGGVAHDFNNLLTVISGYTELVEAGMATDDPRRAQLDEVAKAAGRAAALTGQLLTFSRRQVLKPFVLDLNAVVRGMEKMLGRLLGEDVRIVTDLAPDLHAVHADASQVEQALMNLCLNARDAMPGGGTITLATANVEIAGTGAAGAAGPKPGRYASLMVSDTGTGIPEEVRARIFEPFFTTKAEGKGTGLGLAIVHGFVNQSGGAVDVRSTPGKGTTFRILLPRFEAVPGAVPEASAAPASAGGSETVLVVEDDAAVRAFTRSALAGAGYSVLDAAGMEEALRRCDEHRGPIHLLLTDVVMPADGGRRVAAAVGRSRPGIRVLFMSGYTGTVILRHGVAVDGVALLAKPFTAAGLCAKVREVLDARPRDGGPPATRS